VSRERHAPAGPCSVGPFQGLTQATVATYAEGLREAQRLALIEQVDVWTTYRARWADAVPQTFERLAHHRPQAQAR